MNRETQAQLEAIADMVAMTKQLKVQVWLRGGWAMDFFLGQVSREHLDVDWFVMIDDLSAVAGALVAHGWSRQVTPNEFAPTFLRCDVDFGIDTLTRTTSGKVVVPTGRFRGDPWPDGMIDQAVVGEIAGVRCPVISPESQVEIKRMMPVWVPGRPIRTKDIDDIARLEAALASN